MGLVVVVVGLALVGPMAAMPQVVSLAYLETAQRATK